MPPSLFSSEAWREKAAGGISPGPLRKAFTAEVRRTSGPPDASRVRTFTITTGNPDRERDVISSDGWRLENYLKNPTILFGHDYHSLPIGKALEVRQLANGLEADIEFAPADVYPFASTVLGLVDFGALNAVSVGFDPLKWNRNEERGAYDFTEQELLEVSVVPVPANAEALIAARGAGIDAGPLKAWAEGVIKMLEQPAEGPFGKGWDDLLGEAKAIKSGRVLSASNETRLRNAVGAIVEVLDQLAPAQEALVLDVLAPLAPHMAALAKDAAEAALEAAPAELVVVDFDAILAAERAERAELVTFDPEEFKAEFRAHVLATAQDAVDRRIRQLMGRLD